MRGFALMMAVSAAAGFLSLSQEILWVRVISYTTGSDPRVFGHVLGVFLLGIAFGAFAGKRVCDSDRISQWVFVSICFTLSSIVCFAALPVVGHFMTTGASGLSAAYAAVGLVALLSGGILPVVVHVGIRGGPMSGIALGLVYAANIAGSAAGPLVTGFVFLERYAFEEVFLATSLMLAAVAMAVWLVALRGVFIRVLAAVAMGAMSLLFLNIHWTAYEGLLETLKTGKAGASAYKHVIHNRSGIITVAHGEPDILYGGGVYDGKFAFAPGSPNLIERAYKVGALVRNPADVLEIGYGSGSWTKVILMNSMVKRLDVVEINPGYFGLSRKYPEIGSALEDPRLSVHVDDGRRWLMRNPDRKFDLIVMNTTFHWRSMVTNLLSSEFLQICKRHLNPGGVVYYNATSSADAIYTATKVFDHAVVYTNFVAASDSPFDMTRQERIAGLLKVVLDGEQVFASGRYADSFQRLVADYEDAGSALAGMEAMDPRIITDDNMITEYGHRQMLLDFHHTWPELFRRLGRTGGGRD